MRNILTAWPFHFIFKGSNGSRTPRKDHQKSTVKGFQKDTPKTVACFVCHSCNIHNYVQTRNEIWELISRMTCVRIKSLHTNFSTLPAVHSVLDNPENYFNLPGTLHACKYVSLHKFLQWSMHTAEEVSGMLQYYLPDMNQSRLHHALYLWSN